MHNNELKEAFRFFVTYIAASLLLAILSLAVFFDEKEVDEILNAIFSTLIQL